MAARVTPSCVDRSAPETESAPAERRAERICESTLMGWHAAKRKYNPPSPWPSPPGEGSRSAVSLDSKDLLAYVAGNVLPRTEYLQKLWKMLPGELRFPSPGAEG